MTGYCSYPACLLTGSAGENPDPYNLLMHEHLKNMEYNKSIERLRRIMDELRAGCPWDKKQTIHTLRQQTLEEVYELADALSGSDWEGIREELGDLLLHIVFYSKIASEQNRFSLDDVIESICNKLVNRHPHIYGHVQVKDEAQVKQNWEKLKLKEGKTSVLGGVPESLPAMLKALRVQEKTRQVGFEWDHIHQVREKVTEEITELDEAVAGNEQEAIEAELGDVLFSMVNYARFLNIDPEQALEKTNKKFIRRFQQMESIADAEGKKLHDMNLEEMDGLWNRVKTEES